QTLSRRISNPYLETPSNKIYGESPSCAGRALRNIFTLQASDLIKDRVYLTGICRRSCVGSELVDWLLEQCPFVKCRSTAVGVWQLLLDMGIILSVDRQLYFQDSHTFYQFSADECTYLFCEFEKEEAWKNGVKLLLQLLPLSPPRIDMCNLSDQKIEDTAETNAEILARLTSAVQRELAAVIALKARKSENKCISFKFEICGGVMSWDCGFKYLFALSPTLKAGVLCKLQGRDDIGRIELVQKLARENCQFLQDDRKALEKAKQVDDGGGGGERAREAAGAALVLRKWQHIVNFLKLKPLCILYSFGFIFKGGGPVPALHSNRSRYFLPALANVLYLDLFLSSSAETLLDDFLLTYTVFMTTDDLCQALLRQYPFTEILFICSLTCCTYCAKNHQGKEDDSDVSCRKRKVLHLVSQWTSLYKDWLHEDEHLKQFLKTIYRNVLDDVYEYPVLEKDLKEFQKILGMHRRHTVDEYSPHRKNKTFFHQFSVKENWLQHRGTVNETEEIFCRVYITEHSYVSVKAQVSTSAQDILKIVAEKIQYPEEELALVTVSFSGEKHALQPNDLAISKSLESSSRMFVYRKDLTDSLSPFSENEELQQRSVRILGINTWDLALELTNFDWSLFNAIHEQELIYFTFSRQGSAENTENLSLLLQRCNEVQLWVATEILLCSQLCKRVQLVKKFIKIAAHCKAQRNLNSFFAIVMGLNTASVSRLSQTWEKIPGKFKKLFTELESLTDPSLNHKAYRDAFKKMKSPKIPFMPLLLKDVTFIHEGNKTFLDNLVNFEKLHMIADTVRSLRHCRNNQFGNEVPSKEHHELKPYVHHLHVIDNQQALFELSHRIEPRA
ncbi:RPGF5 factor, partial [Emberiza fucata]|nr:RPGF5 factor [Emberiza fucata]